MSLGNAALFRADGRTYESLRDEFSWQIPVEFNLGVACARAGDPEQIALVCVGKDGVVREVSYAELDNLSDRCASGLRSRGVRRGERVGLVMPQCLETAIAHLAIWKLGAVSLPLASLFGPDALAYRLSDSGASLAIVSPDNLSKVSEAAPDLAVVVTGQGFDELLFADPIVESVATHADDPAYLIYTSGTTADPKGALHAHRSLFGHLPGFELYYEFAPQPNDVIWTPADWSWIGGLMDVLIPALFYDMTVLTADHGFEPAWAVDLMVEHAVTLSFLPPTALKMMRRAGVSRPDLALRAIFTGGEALGADLLEYGLDHLGAPINEGYGQTECNLVVGNCASVWPVRPGSMGRSLPGHEVVVLDDAGDRLIGERGQIAVRSPDPVMMLEYWGNPVATEQKYRNGWLLTGDLGLEDEDGYLWFHSRADDVIISAGYRIGPGEIEQSLAGHEAVAMCAVIGWPDEIRGEVPAAFVVLNDHWEPSDDLTQQLQHHVRTRLAAHEVPKRVTYVAELPTTTTGKIMRRALRL